MGLKKLLAVYATAWCIMAVIAIVGYFICAYPGYVAIGFVFGLMTTIAGAAAR